MTSFDATKFLEDLTGRHARTYARLLGDMVAALATGNRPALRDAREQLADVVAETMGAAEVLGASGVLQGAAKVVSEERLPTGFQAHHYWTVQELVTFATTATQTVLPRVTFVEAVEDMVDRTPTTIRAAAERTAQNIARLYGEGAGGIPRVAFVRSAEAAVTKEVQGVISRAIREGVAEVDAGRRIFKSVEAVRKRTKAWTEGYARMVFRTNVNTAVTAGRFRQARDPDIKKVIPAFRFDDAGDVDVRPNHHAADDRIFLVDNTVWARIAPPLGYNCRCQVSLVGLPELRRMGRVGPDGKIREDRLPATAGPDEGFRHGGRPDLFLGGVG